MTKREQMLTDIYNSPVIHKMIKNIVQDPQEYEDFLSIFYEQICLIDEEKLLSMKDKPNDLRFFLCRLILNQHKSKSSLFYREVKKNKYTGTLNNNHYLSSHLKDIKKKMDNNEDDPFIRKDIFGNITNELDDIIKDSLKHRAEEGKDLDFIIDEDTIYPIEDDLRYDVELEQDIIVELVKQEIHQLHWYKRDIVERHLYGKQKLPEIAKELDIPYSSIWHTYTSAIKHIREQVKNTLRNDTNYITRVIIDNKNATSGFLNN